MTILDLQVLKTYIMPQSKSIYGRGGHQNCNRFYGSTPLNLIISADGFKSIKVVTNPYGDDPMTIYKILQI